MALDIKIEKRKLNFHEHKKEVFVAVPDRNGVIDTDKMAREIAVDTGARPARITYSCDWMSGRFTSATNRLTLSITSVAISPQKSCGLCAEESQ